VTVADQIAQFLMGKGIKHAFGIIGAGNAALFDAIASLGQTEIVCVHHEQAAVMAATFYGRITGRPCVAIVTTGAGSSNALTGALSAQLDSCPVVVLSGNEPSRYLNTQCRVVGVQGFKTSSVSHQVTKRSWTATGLLDLMAAYVICQTGRPGPVWLDYPRDRFNAMV
jgi:acetolactate synthase-1/2/3 large subunit